MNKNQTLLFSLFGASYCLTTLVEPFAFSWLLKLLPLAVLIASCSRAINREQHKYFIGGLLFSSLGDFLLDYNPAHWFIFGLGAFLIAHLFYIKSFTPFKIPRSPKIIGAVVLYIIYGALMFSLIKPGLGQLLLPVFIYMSVLLVMGIASLTGEKSNIWLIVGGMSFVISDSLIGINKFYHALSYGHMMIMISYYFAQYALARGMFTVKR